MNKPNTDRRSLRKQSRISVENRIYYERSFIERLKNRLIRATAPMNKLRLKHRIANSEARIRVYEVTAALTKNNEPKSTVPVA